MQNAKAATTENGVPKIGVLDAGGQYCHLIARKVRELGVYAEIIPSTTPAAQLAKYRGIIISGGPASVLAEKRPEFDEGLFELKLPMLGICYGHQVMAKMFGGKVRQGRQGEYGIAHLKVKTPESIFESLNEVEPVWMSHRDVVEELPEGFEVLGVTDDCRVAAMAHPEKHFYGLQFHPEVVHTKSGQQILKNFVHEICRCSPNGWNPVDRIDKFLTEIRETVGARRKVFFLVSGGVDSTVAFALCVLALGKERVSGLYVNTGFMRKYDVESIEELRAAGMDNIRIVDASRDFMELLKRTYSPEQKRMKIGKKFLEITEQVLGDEFNLASGDWVLGQGTIYPDTIESGGSKHAARIKTHHNRVSIIRKLIQEGKVVEPLHELYKDEVREIGQRIAEQLGLSQRLIYRHPFPGPGLAIRCLASPVSVDVSEHPTVSAATENYKLTHAALNVRTVGVRGDERSYAQVVVLAGGLRSDELESIGDLEQLSTEITNQATDINRVTYCLTEKRFEPGEWRIKRAFLSPERIELLREADNIVMRFMERRSLLREIWQFPVILVPLARKSKGGDSVVLRPVDSIDGMTAQYSKLELTLLRELAGEIMALEGVDAVLMDVTNKPPATIEWE
jgi:GMP synthase (glutamine-hydrolysing)